MPGDRHIESSLDEARFNQYFSMAKASMTIGKPREALQWYQKAAEISPASAAAYNGAGMVFFTLGDFDRARRAFQAAVQTCPDCAQPWYHLALVHELNGDNETAAKLRAGSMAGAPRSKEEQ